MLNDPPIKSEGRTPRALVMVNGERVPGVIEVEVDNNNLYQADTFRCCLSLKAQNPDREWFWWADQTELSVEIFLGFPDNADVFDERDLTSYIYGRTDGIEIDPARDEIILAGRDFTSVLIDSKTAEKFQNKTSSEIAEALAERHGLTPVVTATKTFVGRYYEIDHARITHAQTEWDLLTFLAQEEKYVVYIKGLELHFEPAPDETDDPYVIQWLPPSARPVDSTLESATPRSNTSNIRFSRNLTLANDVIVKVKSWNLKQKNGFTVTAQATHNKKTILKGLPQPTGEAQTYVYEFPNLTQEQALQKAQALLSQITAHEVRLQVALPGDNILTPRTIVQVIGTDTSYDGRYYIDNLVRKMSMRDGYSMDVRLKNHATDSQVSL